MILTNPDPPINLAEDLSLKSGTIVGLTWEKAVNNGGTYVLDYRLSYDQGVGEWLVLYSGITYTNIVVTDLTPGMEYHFKVESRNSFGYSDYSNELIVLSGFVPF